MDHSKEIMSPLKIHPSIVKKPFFVERDGTIQVFYRGEFVNTIASKNEQQKNQSATAKSTD